MTPDEHAIRLPVATWLEAPAANDLPRILMVVSEHAPR
jgi:hypothetical protein